MGILPDCCQCRKETEEEKQAKAEEKAKTEASVKADPIVNTIGQVGWFQIIVAVPCMLGNWPVAAHHLVMIFQKADMKVTCTTPNVTDVCSQECKSFEYDRSIFEETIISEWDLICTRKYLANATQTIAMFGVLLGNIFFGYLGDRFGRRMPLLVTSMMTLGFGTVAAFVPWFWLFCIMRFGVAFATGGVMVMVIVIIMEIVGPNWREAFSVLYQLPFNIGHMSLALINYYLRNWRDAQLTISLVSLFQISYFFLTPESPRWLILNGKQDKAIKILKKGARINKLPQDGIEEKIIECTRRKNDQAMNATILDVAKYPYMRLKAVCMLFNFFSNGLTFFGVADYIGSVAGDMFVNVAFSAAICIPGTFVAIGLCKYWGRKSTLLTASLISGVSLIMIACIPESFHEGTRLCSIIGIFGVSLSFPTIFLYGGELFPTVMRNSAMGICVVFSRVASMIAPFIVQLKDHYYYLPPLIIGVFPLVSACLTLLLPETKGKILPDTIEESEQFGRKTKKANK